MCGWAFRLCAREKERKREREREERERERERENYRIRRQQIPAAYTAICLLRLDAVKVSSCSAPWVTNAMQTSKYNFHSCRAKHRSKGYTTALERQPTKDAQVMYCANRAFGRSLF